MRYFSLILVSSFVFILAGCASGEKPKSPFTVIETDQGVELTENGKPVLAYQKKPKTLTGQYICNNYIHPLYNLNGDILTEEFPADHPYHRGVFWAWHQLYVDGKRLGDGWTNDSISQTVGNVKYEKGENTFHLKLDVLWYSLVLGEGKPFMNENTTITVHKLDSGIRKIDFEIRLSAKVSGFQIGGSADPKGYGGFCVRMRLPDSLIFMSDNGPVIPQELQIKAGPWMDFSGRFGTGQEISGITVLCHPGMPDYPEPWILRKKGSMQNVVFPGSQRIDVPLNKTVVLRYRLIVHNGNAERLNTPFLQQEYATMKSN
jgi:Methane oxygenase PmoA